MANILLNYQTRNLRYAPEELKEHNLFSWRALGNEFSKKTTIDLHPNITENIDLYETDREELAKHIKKFYREKNIDKIFPIYIDMLFPYIYEELGFTTEQADILCNKEKYTALAKSKGIRVPDTYRDIKKAKYPIIAKPVNGTGSVGVKVLKDYSDYFFFVSGEDIHYNDLEKYYIFQDFIDGITISAAGRIVDGEVLFDCIYTIESSELPYRAETGFIFTPQMIAGDTINSYIKTLLEALNIENCAWMADFIIKDGEVYLVDFSPRVSVSAQAIIKYGANINYNKIVLDSLLYKDKTKIELTKSVVYRYFDLPKGKYNIDFTGDQSLADELVFPEKQTYMNRIDILMPTKGYCITSGSTLADAENKWAEVARNIKYTTEV